MPASRLSRARTKGTGGGASADLHEIYDALDVAYRDAIWHWMPDIASDPMEIIAGAILVQHTTWSNAERALTDLRHARALTPHALIAMPDAELYALVRVSGTPTVKMRRLRAVATTLHAAGGVDAFLEQPPGALREALLAIHGIGPETADAIALYAAGARTFVIDAYTRRLFRRLEIGPETDTYDVWKRYFEDALDDAPIDIYRRYHGYIVLHGKEFCRAVPRCHACPLLDRCPTGAARTMVPPGGAAL